MRWRDPRTYHESLDPLEFAWSILNETTDRGVENGNDLRDLDWFQPMRPKLIEHLDRVVRNLPTLLTLEVSDDVGVRLSGLVIQPTKRGARFYKSIRATRYEHRWVTVLAVWLLLELPGNADRKARLCRCSFCGRFFFHSQKRKNRLTPCSDSCKVGKYLTKRDRDARNRYERELRERERRKRGRGVRERVVSVFASFDPKKITTP